MTMPASASISDHARSLVRRTRAGDQNAWAMIYRIGEEARRGGNRRAEAMAQAIKQQLAGATDNDMEMEDGPALIMDGPRTAAPHRKAAPASASANMGADAPGRVHATARDKAAAIEAKKPPVPRGLFDGLHDPNQMAEVILNACKYRNGLQAAAVLLAAGPPLTNLRLGEICKTTFGSEESQGAFIHGVKHSDDQTWEELAPQLDLPLKRCLAIGQCLGRARRIQDLRRPKSRISDYSAVAGWELGE